MSRTRLPPAVPVLICLLAAAPAAAGADAIPALSSAPASDRFTVHYQATVIDQGNARFTAPYSGPNSLHAAPESATSVSSTLFLGVRLFPGTEAYVDPELTAGSGISGSRGVAGFPNGETFRIGETAPTIYAARMYLKQVFGFGGETERLEDGPNQVADAVAARRVTVVAGKFGLADFFDGNAYAHDPRSQFMNWTLMAAGAWDYPADTRGYTWGLMTEYREPGWAVRGAVVAEPKEANMLDFDRRVGRANGSVIEGEHELHLIEGRRGAARLLAYLNQARMGNYDQALSRPGVPDVTATREYGRTKYGFSFNADHELTGTLGGFARASWNDGRNETWTFTEVDASQSLGAEWTPKRWSRPRDRWGAAAVVNELSGPHRRYLANGGSGFILGDGALHDGPEMIAETYYRCEVREHLFVSPDYQFVVNPGYNRARGPVSIWAVRVHAEF